MVLLAMFAHKSMEMSCLIHCCSRCVFWSMSGLVVERVKGAKKDKTKLNDEKLHGMIKNIIDESDRTKMNVKSIHKGLETQPESSCGPEALERNNGGKGL